MLRKERVINEVLGADTSLTPSDLYNKEFSKSTFGGYDRKEVDEFLEHVAEVWEGLIGQVRALRDKHEEQRKSLDELKNLETTMRNALIASQRYGEDVLDSARREAHVLLEEARMEKERAQLDAMKLPESLARDIQLLEQQRSRLRVEMLSILETHKRLLDSLVPAPTVPSSLGGGFAEPSQEARTPQFLPGLGSGGPSQQFAPAYAAAPSAPSFAPQPAPIAAAPYAAPQQPAPSAPQVPPPQPSFDQDDEGDEEEPPVHWKMDS
jgi:cell division initiation protein